MRAEREKIHRMFSDIAPQYDFLNHVLSFNIDQSWRRKACTLIDPPSRARVLDLGAGTGDFAHAWLNEHSDTDMLVLADFAEPMLKLARQKLPISATISMVCCDALQLPWSTATFDVVLCAFGVRNFANLETGLKEIARVTKPGGHVVILEFCSTKRFWIANLYCKYVVPLVGYLFTHHRQAYEYLATSMEEFVTPSHLQGQLEKAGFDKVAWTDFIWHIATAFWGVRI